MLTVIHLGLPKTGTKSIQSAVSRHRPLLSPAAADRRGGPGDAERRRLIDRLAEVAGLDDPTAFWRSEAAQPLALNLRSHLSKTVDGDRAALSWEGLTHLRALGAPASDVGFNTRAGANLDGIVRSARLGPVTVVLTVRRQPEWLASMYAQSARHRSHPGQRDFARWVDDVLRREGRVRDDPLGWLGLVRDVSRITGEPPSIVPLEGLDSDRAWHSLGGSFGLPSLEDDLSARATRLNARAVGVDRWLLNLPTGGKDGLRRAIGRSPRIRLRSELRRDIEDACRETNRELDAVCAFALTALGYTV